MTTLATEQPQHLKALGRANEVRLARCALKRRIAAGETTATDVILQCPWEAASMTIAELLTAQRRWAEKRASNFCGLVGMPEMKTIGAMTERQRALLADLLSGGGA